MKLSERLYQKAAYFRSLSPELVAVDMLKQAGMAEADAVLQVAQLEMEKTATAGMVAAGVDYDRALEMVKQSGIKIDELDGYSREKSVEELAWEELTKMAFEVETHEREVEALRHQASKAEEALEKVAELQEFIDSLPEPVEEVPDALTKLASSGTFTNEDLDAMIKLPTQTLEKLATTANEPWRMGKAAGTSTTSLDPLAAFALGE